MTIQAKRLTRPSNVVGIPQQLLSFCIIGMANSAAGGQDPTVPLFTAPVDLVIERVDVSVANNVGLGVSADIVRGTTTGAVETTYTKVYHVEDDITNLAAGAATYSNSNWFKSGGVTLVGTNDSPGENVIRAGESVALRFSAAPEEVVMNVTLRISTIVHDKQTRGQRPTLQPADFRDQDVLVTVILDGGRTDNTAECGYPLLTAPGRVLVEDIFFHGTNQQADTTVVFGKQSSNGSLMTADWTAVTASVNPARTRLTGDETRFVRLQGDFLTKTGVTSRASGGGEPSQNLLTEGQVLGLQASTKLEDSFDQVTILLRISTLHEPNYGSSVAGGRGAAHLGGKPKAWPSLIVAGFAQPGATLQKLFLADRPVAVEQAYVQVTGSPAVDATGSTSGSSYAGGAVEVALTVVKTDNTDKVSFTDDIEVGNADTSTTNAPVLLTMMSLGERAAAPQFLEETAAGVQSDLGVGVVLQGESVSVDWTMDAAPVQAPVAVTMLLTTVVEDVVTA